MTNIERRLIISQLEKAKENHKRCILQSVKMIGSKNRKQLNDTPEIDSLIDLLGAGKV